MNAPQIKEFRSGDIVAQAEQEFEGVPREYALWLMEHEELPLLLAAASARRDKWIGKTISFSKKVFIPLTRLCRDYCGYCTFRRDPGQPGGGFLSTDDVRSIALAGREAGCKEALFSLGDQPEKLFPEAAEDLRRMGYRRTLEYLADMCEMVLDATGLLPHCNPGVMDREDLARLKNSNVSMGLMLESTSTRLMRKGEAHWRAPDKVPLLRLRTIEEAGRQGIAFTTGILIGIGETLEERVDSLLAIRALHERYGHIQEVIVQNFRAKEGTRFQQMAEPGAEDLLRTLAIARLILPGTVNLQAPPNLSYQGFPRLIDGGLNDWGGISPVTKDHINPEAPWPAIRLLREKTEAAGYVLRERLALYPEFVRAPECLRRNAEWFGPEPARREEFAGPRLFSYLEKLRDQDGYARDSTSN
ncbi:MAG: 7,8-didemethyl-8-hydroxy-5-deazariboflavin synthase CofG [Candidatus Acidiferrales bacterium]|jgi:FO synthase